MACLPESGGCERPIADSLVATINATEGTSFRHVMCLDVSIRDRPQPEALYRDEHTGQELVIEHKTVLWPLDYVQRHKNDHEIADRLFRMLADMTTDQTYQLDLPHMFKGTGRELTRFVGDVSAAIHKHIDRVRFGPGIRGTANGYAWSFRRRDENDWGEDDPESGLMISWQTNPLNRDPELPASFREQVAKHFEACRKKFAEYADARKILVLLPQGDLEFGVRVHWAGLLATSSVPGFLDEVWEGAFGPEEGVEPFWHWQHLFPVHPDESPSLPIDLAALPELTYLFED